jgi:DNA-binding transcriptional ArsR family regulator
MTQSAIFHQLSVLKKSKLVKYRREGKTVFYTGELLDKQGKKYAGYITLNKENGKLDFMFPKEYKEALASGKVFPDDCHKTQVAVNSETTNEARAEAKLVSTMPCKEEFFLRSEKNGKTNEATKNLKEPLKQGQTKPDEKQTEKQTAKQEKEEKPNRKKGVKL